jgi:hypothetical protein
MIPIPSVGGGKARIPSYYEKYGASCDAIVRCTDCQTLQLVERLARLGCCPCGCRRVKEVSTLSGEEMAQIESGALDFPHRDEFLAEFHRVE